jgi:prefoldin subunit 5
MKKLTEDMSTQSMTSASSHTSLISEGTVPSKFGNVTTGYLSPIKMEEIARDACSKNTQTVETAFVPCEACHVVQKSFRNAGDTLINMCQAQKLPSSLQKYRPLVAEVKWLSANDVIRWAGEQNKDLSRMSNHMDNLMASINPLKNELEQFEKKYKHLEKRVSNFDSDMRKEKEVQYALQRQFDIKIKDLEQSHNETVAMVTRQKDEILQDRESLSTEVTKLKTHLEQQQKLLIDIGIILCVIVFSTLYQIYNTVELVQSDTTVF